MWQTKIYGYWDRNKQLDIVTVVDIDKYYLLSDKEDQDQDQDQVTIKSRILSRTHLSIKNHLCLIILSVIQGLIYPHFIIFNCVFFFYYFWDWQAIYICFSTVIIIKGSASSDSLSRRANISDYSGSRSDKGHSLKNPETNALLSISSYISPRGECQIRSAYRFQDIFDQT